MAFQSVPQTAELIIEGFIGTEECFNTLGFKFAGEYTIVDIEALAEAVWTYLDTSLWGAAHGVNYFVRDVKVRGLENLNDYEAVFADGNINGTEGTTMLPNNVAWVIKFLTGLTGRSARGRNYIGGFSTQHTSGNALAEVVAENLITVYEGIQTAASGAGWTHSVISRQTGGVLRPTGVTFPVSNITYSDLVLDSQRRRLPAH